MVALGAEGKLVRYEIVSRLFPCAGVVQGDALKANDAWTDLEFRDRHRNYLRGCALSLYEDLIKQVEAEPPTEVSADSGDESAGESLRGRLRRAVEGWSGSDPVRDFLRVTVLRLYDEKRRAAKWGDNRHRRIYKKLCGLPLFQLRNGRWISLHLARSELPTELAPMLPEDLAQRREQERREAAELERRERRQREKAEAKARRKAEAERARAQQEAQREAARIRAAEVAQAEARLLEEQAERDRAAREAQEAKDAKRRADDMAAEVTVFVPPALEPEPKPEAEPVEEPPPPPKPAPSPTQILLEQIRAELRLVRRGNEKVLADRHLDALRFDRLPHDILSAPREDSVVINMAHRVVATALDQDPVDPILVSVIASSAYTALNRWLEDISDADEAMFHRLHAEHLSR